MRKEDSSPPVDFRTFLEYWNNHTPEDDCTLEPSQFSVVTSAGVNMDTRDNMEFVNKAIANFTKEPTEPIRTVAGTNRYDTLLPIDNLPSGSVIGVSKEIFMQDQKGKSQYTICYEFGVIQEENTTERTRYIHVKGSNGVHYAYPGETVEIGKVRHVKMEGPYGSSWHLERTLGAELLVYAKPKIRQPVQTQEGQELKKGIVRRILRK